MSTKVTRITKKRTGIIQSSLRATNSPRANQRLLRNRSAARAPLPGAPFAVTAMVRGQLVLGYRGLCEELVSERRGVVQRGLDHALDPALDHLHGRALVQHPARGVLQEHVLG